MPNSARLRFVMAGFARWPNIRATRNSLND